MITLQLEALRFADARHWHWRLTDSEGNLMKTADGDDAYAEIAVTDSAGGFAGDGTSDWLWASVSGAADPRTAMIEASRKLGDCVLPVIGSLIVDQNPVTVRVRIPVEAAELLSFPLELAAAVNPQGGNLARLGEEYVTFVYELDAGKSSNGKDAIRESLKVLAIFSGQTDAIYAALNVEKRQLKSQIHSEIANGRSIYPRLLRYGMTRNDLHECLLEAGNWDLVHITGYELSKGIAMWQDRPMSLTDLLIELRLVRRQLKAVMLVNRAAPATSGPADAHMTEAAAEFARALDCAVLTFRHPACDGFARDFTEALFRNLLSRKQPLADAVMLANQAVCARIAHVHGWCCRPGPALFGPGAVGLSLNPPERQQHSYSVNQLKMVSVPGEDKILHTAPVDQYRLAESALKEDSPQRGVVYLGSATHTFSYALELVHEHKDYFQKVVWYAGPGSFDELTSALDQKLIGLEMARQTNSLDALRNFAPKLSELLRESLVILVLADVDQLLTSDGNWVDESWKLVVEAMYKDTGRSRLIITSQVRPQGMESQMAFIEAGIGSGAKD